MLDRSAFKTIAARLSDGVVITDAEGRITWTNQAFHDMCGHSKARVLNRKPGSFLQGEDTDQETVARIRKALHAGEPVAAEILNYHASGRPYWVSIRITPIRGRSGRLTGFIAIERETTPSRTKLHSLEHQVAELYSTLLTAVLEQPTR